jgi:hypothetical protein
MQLNSPQSNMANISAETKNIGKRTSRAPSDRRGAIWKPVRVNCREMEYLCGWLGEQGPRRNILDRANCEPPNWCSQTIHFLNSLLIIFHRQINLIGIDTDSSDNVKFLKYLIDECQRVVL